MFSFKAKCLFLSIIISILFCTALFAGGAGEDSSDPSPEQDFTIGVFVPGVVEGSPTYEMLVEGVQSAADTKGLSEDSVQIIEGGYNQAEWGNSLTAMVAGGNYDLIVSSNPALPELAIEIAKDFPNQKFLIMDSHRADHSQIKTIFFDKYMQSYVAGYFAGLYLTGPNVMGNRIGLLAGQEYPMMDRLIKPGFIDGARAVDSSIELDFRVLGNWYDAGKAQDLVSAMIDDGVEIVLPIAGGGNFGAISAAREKDARVIWYDSPGFDYDPEIVIASVIVDQREFTADAVIAAIEDTLDFGIPSIVGFAEGGIKFIDDHPSYLNGTDIDLQEVMALMLEQVSAGSWSINRPEIP